MLYKKTVTMLLALVLIGSMTLPTLAAEPIPAQQGLKPVISENVTVDAEEHPMTRAELLSALYEKEGTPAVNFAMDYTDVDPEAEYAEAIRWASAEGIAGGYGNKTFGPNDPVTREQMAVILYRHAQSNGQGFTGAWAFPLPYADAEAVSPFAYEAVCWITMKDIMGDTGDNRFDPDGQVTHQEAGAVLEQYFQVTEQTTEVANPLHSCQSISEAAQIAGFSMELPDTMPGWGEPAAIQAMESGLIEVIYEGDRGQLTLRKGAGTEDISGDYGVYSEVTTEDVNGTVITLKGEDGNVITATWSKDGYAYAIRAAAGLERDDVLSMAQNMV